MCVCNCYAAPDPDLVLNHDERHDGSSFRMFYLPEKGKWSGIVERRRQQQGEQDVGGSEKRKLKEQEMRAEREKQLFFLSWPLLRGPLAPHVAWAAAGVEAGLQ